jgi:hypothetical protein
MLVVGGFSVDIHVACDDRISLYPAAPFRLATLLHAWTIAQVGRGSSLVRQTGWARSANPHNSHTSDPPNAPEGASELQMDHATSVVTGWRDGTLRHEALFKEAPQRDRQFARNCNNHDPSDTPALPCTNQRVIALFGWCLSQSQAAWIMVPRTWPRPAREIPWDRSTSPLS